MKDTVVVSRWDGSILRELRDDQKMSRRQLMFKLQPLRPKPPAERTIQRWEEGETVPGANDLAALAQVFGCKVEDFYGRSAA